MVMASLSTNVRIKLNGEQSKSNVCTHRCQNFFYFFLFGMTDWAEEEKKNGVKVKPKLREQDEAFPHSHTKIAFWENFALTTHYMKIFSFLFFFKWRIEIEWLRMWCLNKASITSSELNDYLHTDTWQCWDVVPPCLQWCFFFRSYRGAKSHDCNKSKRISDAMELFCMLAKPLWFDQSCFFCTLAIYSL